MLITIFILLFIIFFIIFEVILKLIFKSRLIINLRLGKLKRSDDKINDNELNQPFFIRFIKPVLNDMTGTILKITPKELINNLEKKIINAGNPYNRTVKDWINLQVVILVFVPSVTCFFSILNKLPLNITLLVILSEITIGLLLPYIILKRKIDERQQKIRNSMPDCLDLLSVSVEAGLAFDGAVSKVIEKIKGPISEEFCLVLQEMKVGKNKRDALKDMAQRVNLQDLTSFVGAIIQADQLGVSISNVLRIQSKQMREKRRQRAQEKAMKAPVKMLIPMVLFIFPTIFSVLIGPVVIKAIDMFTK